MTAGRLGAARADVCSFPAIIPPQRIEISTSVLRFAAHFTESICWENNPPA
jgi:hypothetical protein